MLKNLVGLKEVSKDPGPRKEIGTLCRTGTRSI